MSYSKPVPPFVFDSLYYLNRDQLERFLIVCRSLKNFIDRYFRSKPYRVFDQLEICEGSYALFNRHEQWHPNRDDYNIQCFLANQKCVRLYATNVCNLPTYHSFTEIRPYLDPTVRIKQTSIYIAGGYFNNPEQIAEIESIAYLWRDGNIEILKAGTFRSRIFAEDFPMILNSPTILQSRCLKMDNACFSFKDYKVLKTVNTIDVNYYYKEIDPDHWIQFLDQPGLKPVFVFRELRRLNFETLLDSLLKAYSSAVSPNAFKIVFVRLDEELIEFRETNKTSSEKLELKKGHPSIYGNAWNGYKYTLERSSL